MNLLFDFGGVLVDLNKQRCIDAFAGLGFDIRPFLGTYAQAGVFAQLERGELSVVEFCEELRRLSGRVDLSDETLVKAWESYLMDVPAERLETLLKAKKNYPIYLLSNTNEIHWRQGREEFFRYKGLQVEDFFDGVFLSYEMGIEKPHPSIFDKVVEGIGCAPSEILFFDDSEVNCEAARKQGLLARLAPADSAWLKDFDETGKLTFIPGDK